MQQKMEPKRIFSEREGARIVAIINRRACIPARDPSMCSRRNLLKILRPLGKIEAHVVEPDHLRIAVIRAAESNPDVIVIGGGDGTIGTAAHCLSGTRIALGVLPMGTLNHFARDLGMPPAWEESVLSLANAEIRIIDLGEVNGRIFINNSSIGIYPEAVALRENFNGAFAVSKYAAMAIAVFKLFWDYRIMKLFIEFQGGARKPILTPFLFVGNNRYEPALFSAAGRPSLSEGALNVLYASKTGRLKLAKIAIKALLGSKNSPEMREMCVSELIIRSRKKRLRVALDGEVTTMDAPLHYKIIKESLRVLSPQEKQ